MSDVTVVTDLAGSTGTVAYEVESAGGLEVRVVLTDADGTEVARATGGTAS